MKKTNIIIPVFAIALCLAGCGAKVDDMTDAQTELVTEYATHILLKHSSTSNKNLLNEEKLKAEEEKEAKIRERNKKIQEAKEAYLNSDGKKEENSQKEDLDNSNTDDKKEVVEKEYLDNAASLMKAESFNLTFNDYNLCTTYPEEKREDDFLSIEAKEGKQLVVLKFKAENQLAEEQDLDLFSKGGRFFLSVNGEEVVESSPTILMDDLSMFKGKVKASETKDLVLLFETEVNTEIESMELTIKCGDQKGYMKLK